MRISVSEVMGAFDDVVDAIVRTATARVEAAHDAEGIASASNQGA